MAGGRLARRYARALIDLSEAHKVATPIKRDLDRFCRLFQADAEFRAFLVNPSAEMERRDRILTTALDAIGGVHKLARNFLRLLLQNGRIDLVDGVRLEFVAMQDELAGRIRANVVSATSLDPASRTSLQHALEKLFAKKVILETETDSSLIGGVLTRVGHVVLDGSLRAQLDRIRTELSTEL